MEIRETVQEIVVPVYVEAELSDAERSPKRPLFAGSAGRRAARLRRAGRVARRRRDGDRGTLLSPRRPSARARQPRLCSSWPRVASPACRRRSNRQRPVRTSRRAAPLPRHDERRGARARARLSVGEVDRLPSPRSARAGRAGLQRPGRVSGSAGTGKTIVALHRAALLARTNPDARVLLTTFSDPLANALRVKLRRLIGNEPRLARTHRRSLDRRHRRTPLQGASRAAELRIAERLFASSSERRSAQRSGPQVQPALPGHGVGADRRSRGSSRVGKAIAMSHDWAARRGCRKVNAAVLWSIFERVRSGLAGSRTDDAGRLSSARWRRQSHVQARFCSTHVSSTRRRT